MKRLYTVIAILLGLQSQLSGSSVDEFRSSCKRLEMAGCYHLGSAYLRGDGVYKNLENARRFFGFACDNGLEEACNMMQSLNKKVEAKNYKGENRQDRSSVKNKIKEYVLGVIKHGSAQFNYPMETMPKDMATGADAEYIAEYVSGGMRGEVPAAFAVCAACHGDDGRGSGGLSADLLNLKGIKFEVKVNSKVMKYRDACDRGDGFACYDLALAYETGKYGLDKDLEEAISYYVAASNSGKKEADKKIEEIALLLLGSSRAQLSPNKADSETIKFAKEFIRSQKEFIRSQKELRELSDLIQNLNRDDF